MDYLMIKYRNSCDNYGSLFTNQIFWYVFFLDVDIGKPTFELIEEGREDGEKNAIIDFRKQIKKYSFKTKVPEYQFDCLNTIQMHDTIQVKTKFDEYSEVFDWTVINEGWSERGDYVDVTINFSVRYDLKLNCCSNDKPVYVPCLSCNPRIAVEDWVNGPLADVTLPNHDRAWILIGKENALTGELELNTLYYYRYDGWAIYNATLFEVICFTYNGIAYKFWFDGNYWQPAHVIRDYTDSGNTITIRGWFYPNTWGQLYISTDAVNYTTVGSPTQAGTFNSTGVTASGLTPAVTYYFKFSMYNNNCNYGYSNVLSVVKS